MLSAACQVISTASYYLFEDNVAVGINCYVTEMALCKVWGRGYD